jgi:DNA-directed RNA polymerase specialized sigma24 family protein
MEPTNPQHPALTFVSANAEQIRGKARKFGFEVEDFQQDVLLFILEHGHKYDGARGNFNAFVFGSLEKIMRHQVLGAHRYAVSLDTDDISGEFLRARLEDVATVSDEDALHVYSAKGIAPGAAQLVAIAQAISGMSALEFATARGVTKRRVNQILKRARDEARMQFALDFADEVTA